MSIKVIPAIDILDGFVVRLKKGNYAQQTQYSQDPLAVIQRYQELGAQRIHLVDLSGAKDEQDVQTQYISKITQTVPCKFQVGGGIRSAASIQYYLDHGVESVVVGSLAVSEPEVIIEAIQQYGYQRIIIAADCKKDDQGEFYIATHGWQETRSITVNAFLERFLQDVPKLRVLSTDIDHDGMMNGPSLDLYQNLATYKNQVEVIASGGVRNMTDIQALDHMQVFGVVLGKTLLDGTLTIQEVNAYL